MIHVASPFPAENPRDEMEVIGPAVEGTKNVLEACAKTKGGVQRVVLTSSCASIYGKTFFILILMCSFCHVHMTSVRLVQSIGSIST